MDVMDLQQASTAFPVPISQDLVACPPAVQPGQQLADRYIVGERIGGGGMADVFRGQDPYLRREVAIKVLKPGIASAEMCARMLQEGRAAAAIDHAHLLRVLDIGRVGSSVYLITDLLRGHSLAEYLRISPGLRLGWQRAIGLLLPALDALQKVHDHGYLHRDLKPDNLFVHRRDGQEVLIVLDLGIAKVAPALRGEGAPLPTETGRLLGTPAYMSPEQAGSLPLDHRTDVYSMGVTLHRMLAGRLPFEPGPGDTPYALMAQHIFQVPPRLCNLDPEIPEALADVVLRTLAKAPRDRPQSMHDLAAELRACLTLPAVAGASAEQSLTGTRDLRRVRGTGGVTALAATMILHGPTPHAATMTPDPQARRIFMPPELPTSYPSLPIQIPVLPEVPATPAVGATPDAPAHESSRQTPPPARSAAVLAPVLGAAAGPVAACIREHGGLDISAITVTVTLHPGGRVTRVALHDRDDTTLPACVRPVLASLRFPAGPAQRLTHTFQRHAR